MLRSWLTGILVAAILCAGIDLLAGKLGKTGGVVKSICAVFFLLAVFSPIASMDLEGVLEAGLSRLSVDMSPVEEGAQDGKNFLREIISQKATTYILERASQLEANVEVSVHVSGEEIPVPDSVEIIGTLSPYGREALESYIVQQLGITKEAIHWKSQ